MKILLYICGVRTRALSHAFSARKKHAQCVFIPLNLHFSTVSVLQCYCNLNLVYTTKIGRILAWIVCDVTYYTIDVAFILDDMHHVITSFEFYSYEYKNLTR